MKTLLAGILAATAVVAQMTGEFGRATSTGGMMGGMMGGTAFGGVLFTIFWVGLVLLVWLWVVKLWKEVRRMK